MTESFATQYLRQTVDQFRRLKTLADRALAQIPDADLFAMLGEESNSAAVLMKHVAGNMRSRWTDFLTSDGEKPDRGRDEEFEIRESDTPQALRDRWEAGWACLFAALEALTEADLDTTVYVRSEPLTVVGAIGRQHSHYASHVGQLVMLAKVLRGREWQTLSIPRGQSEEVLLRMRRRWEDRRGHPLIDKPADRGA